MTALSDGSYEIVRVQPKERSGFWLVLIGAVVVGLAIWGMG